jgi:hypothetical protein
MATKPKSPSKRKARSTPAPSASPVPDFTVLREGELRRVPLASIKPYENNPRNITKAAVAAVKKSIKDYGYNVPIVVDKDMVIVTGHTRHQACKALDMGEVYVLIAAHLTEKQAKEFRVADNRIGDMASWDDALLIPELRAVGTKGEMDAYFKDGELEKLIGSLEEAGKVVTTPSQKEIDGKKTSLDGKFKDSNEKVTRNLIQVTCQHCAEKFGVDRRLQLK